MKERVKKRIGHLSSASDEIFIVARESIHAIKIKNVHNNNNDHNTRRNIEYKKKKINREQ